MNSPECSGRRHVVVVNSEAEFLVVVRALLEDEGYEVSTMHVDEQPFDIVVAVQPTAIVLDFVYEKPEGWHLLAELDADPRTRGIPLLVTSTDEVLIERALAQCEHRIARGMLVKPLELDALVEEVNRLAAVGQVS